MKNKTTNMNKKLLPAYFATIIIFVSFLTYNIILSSQWMIDNVIAIVLITVFLFVSEQLKFGKIEFALLSLAFLIHNMGTFRFYEFEINRIIAYDTIGHFLIAVIGAYVVFNFVVKRYDTSKLGKPSLVLLVVCLLLALGVFVEVIEFTGFMTLGEGEGVLMAGPGDGYGPLEMYIDVVQDLIVDIIGGFVGAFAYLFFGSRITKPLYIDK